MRTAIVAAHSSAPMQRKVSHILVRADQPEILDEIEERLAGKRIMPRYQALHTAVLDACLSCSRSCSSMIMQHAHAA